MTLIKHMATKRDHQAGPIYPMSRVLPLAIAFALQGCAFTYTDASGDRHCIGLFAITVRAPTDATAIAGNVIEIASVGISAGQTAQGGYVSAGFNRETTAFLRDNALVV